MTLEVAQHPFFELIRRVRWVTFAGAGHLTHIEGNGIQEKVLQTVGHFLTPK